MAEDNVVGRGRWRAPKREREGAVRTSGDCRRDMAEYGRQGSGIGLMYRGEDIQERTNYAAYRSSGRQMEPEMGAFANWVEQDIQKQLVTNKYKQNILKLRQKKVRSTI
ncbi:hypothetical protein DFH09DRAFT_1070386 [Mycena vulgaris]|nr:hypothetical protein DFH09DRAFT_1070386 [Mycena vulgaris]